MPGTKNPNFDPSTRRRGIFQYGTFKGKTIKNYCPWVHTQKNPGTYCKQKQNNVLVSTACPCACAGY